MDIEQLRTFDRIVRDGSFTKAAARLSVTQATVSMRVRALEAALGGTLFERGRTVRLTERGATFLPYARRVLATVIEGEDALRAVDRGRIAFATLRSVVATLAAAPVAELARAHPLVELTVEEGRHRDIAEWLHDRRLDLAVMGWPNLDPLLDFLEPLAIFRERVVLAAAPAVAAAIGPQPTLDRIFGIVPHFLTFFWWQVTPEPILALRRRARASSRMLFEPGLALIEAGLAVGHLLEPQARAAIEAGRLVDLAPVDMPPVHRDSALVAGMPGALERPLVAELAGLVVARARALGTLAAEPRKPAAAA
ncbi:LysR family transcriptional regulator [Prosthecomicrobium pneumaticum]|uniref:DNA-binding transcriptional LysR family regulator n=1 Tax=Prosthecomicrobium pneumaticum TaxID=81895 RepID=A0A7W9FLU2_9HYPH|nr:LysR family transcriptional regulator [Prosthecomicrobium pneumaticum]MBB5753048.1 DNA-binding transcriptional LysR family regulator [Prosthecomicrobium pneumaticum]